MPSRPRTHFGPEEEDAFFAARDALVAEYEAATKGRPARHADADPFVAEIMLDFKWGYGDGRITTWTTSDLEELLLSHYPRKVLLREEEILRVVPAVKDFIAYLRDRGLLAGDPLPALAARLDALLPDFADAMTDRRRFGMAKQIGSLMLADGVDLGAQEAVDGWLEDVNAAPPDELAVIFGPNDEEPERERLVLPAIELVPTIELAAAAADSPPVARLAGFTRYVGEGRRLTSNGNLTVADGRALVSLLGTGDLVDPVIGERRFQTRSTTELPRLGLVFRWAKAAGFVKVRSGRVSATARGRRLGRDPLDDWGRAFEAYFRADPFGLRLDRWAPFWAELLAEVLDELPLLLYIGTEPVDLQALKDDIWAAAEEGYDVEALGLAPASFRQHLDESLEVSVIGPLVELGAVRLEEGRLALTDLGRWGTNRLLRRRGHVAPIVGEHALDSAEELLRACAELPLAEAEREIGIWIERHPWTAARDLVGALRAPSLAGLALHALELVGRSAEAEVRALADDPAVGGYARLWLVRQGLEPRESLPPAVLAATLVDQLSTQLDDAGALKTVAAIAAMGPDEAEQLRFVDDVAAASHPRVGELLGAIARYHPLARVREAAGRRAGQRGRGPAQRGRGPALH